MKRDSYTWFTETLTALQQESPDRFDAVLASLRREAPEVFEEICLVAVATGRLTQSECAEILATDTRSLGIRLACHDQAEPESSSSLIEVGANGIAKLKGTHVTVWEIAREFRKHDSVKTLNESYAGLTEKELRAALQYAGRNPDEISGQIRDYEARFSNVRTD
ncbi:DUF433 domain-containing protein [Kamptonema cortianum]|nr:DUF433 domain-containing protein [Geitlerinema splendidum]MDK3156280.1 DUF433 domain-containing protein [Kamptonema cortianum]